MAYIIDYVHGSYKRRQQELAADNFAFTTLTKHNKLGMCLANIADHIDRHEQLPKIQTILASPFSIHPPDIERARNGLQMLQEHGVNISELIENMPSDAGDNTRKCLPNFIKKYFPEMIIPK